MFSTPRRIRRQAGRFSRVDGIPYELPIHSEGSPALMAAFTCDARAAARLMPGNEVHPLRISRKRGVLFITVIDYRVTDIGAYIEFSIALACTHGPKPARPLLPLLRPKHHGLGQFVVDLPVSTEISVKGGKGIWGMPKHLANLGYRIQKDSVSSRYDQDGAMVARIEIERPRHAWLPLRAAGVNYCAFRGMLMKSFIYFHGRFGFRFGRRAKARLELGPHPRAVPLKSLAISPRAFFTGFLPAASGVLDDHFESWFLSATRLPDKTLPEGLESVVDLGLGQQPMPPPPATDAHAEARP